MMSQIRVIGTGEAFDSQFGNTSYLFQGSEYPTILFDCGYQVPERLWRENLHEGLDAVCLTHLHADHAFGLVPLLARYWEEGRKKTLYIFGPKGTETYLKRLFDLGYPGFMKRLKYPIHFKQLSHGKPMRWKKLEFACGRTVHSVLNHTVKVTLDKKKKISFAVSGDGQITPETKALVSDVSLLLQEVYTSEPEVPVHADLKTLKEFILHSSFGRVGVVHQSRSHVSKVNRGVMSLKKEDSRWFIASPGAIISLK
jgi:ribonuclease BN (tRNA processing enzyme)